MKPTHRSNSWLVAAVFIGALLSSTGTVLVMRQGADTPKLCHSLIDKTCDSCRNWLTSGIQGVHNQIEAIEASKVKALAEAKALAVQEKAVGPEKPEKEKEEEE